MLGGGEASVQQLIFFLTIPYNYVREKQKRNIILHTHLILVFTDSFVNRLYFLIKRPTLSISSNPMITYVLIGVTLIIIHGKFWERTLHMPPIVFPQRPMKAAAIL
jgi:hypothetical protein